MSNDAALRFLTTAGATKWQYQNGVANTESVSPDTWGQVQPLLDCKGNQEIQPQMFYSYGTNQPPFWSGTKTLKFFLPQVQSPTK